METEFKKAIDEYFSSEDNKIFLNEKNEEKDNGSIFYPFSKNWR